jgi:GntR family transcriptional repressor for pyruvate dehydrogenase complex
MSTTEGRGSKERPTAVARVVAVLARRIDSGELTPGDKLPGEATLATELSVSRPIIREALGQLRERGYVTTINGSGTYVQSPDAETIADALRRHLRLADQGSISSAQLYEARAAIEVTAARLAAERASFEGLETLRGLLHAMRTSARNSTAYSSADMAFHVELARASGNPLLPTLLEPLVEIIVTGMIESHGREGAADDGISMHARVLDCVERGDAEGAGLAMAEHLARSEELFPDHVLERRTTRADSHR